MKSNTKKIIAVLLVLMLSLSVLSACGGETLSGKYICIDMVSEDEEMSYADLKAFMAFAEEEWIDPYLEFLDGDNFKIEFMDEVENGTYKVNGNSIDLTSDGETITGKIDGKKITLEIEGTKMVFEKK